MSWMIKILSNQVLYLGVHLCFCQEKKNGSKRLSIDYRRLNYVFVKSWYSLPRINDLLVQLDGVKSLSQI